jgi:hypothetical protein
MAVNETQIETLRRLVAEPAVTTYSDALLQTFIEARAVADARGVEPTKWNYSTVPPTEIANDMWNPTYDLNAAAADIWEEKAAAVAQDYAFSADGASYSRNQVYDQYSRMAKRFRSKARIGSVKFLRVHRELTRHGEVVETTPIIDRLESDRPFNYA